MALAASIGLKPEFSIYIIKFDLGHIVFTLWPTFSAAADLLP
jgi:hypothetical protein